MTDEELKIDRIYRLQNRSDKIAYIEVLFIFSDRRFYDCAGEILITNNGDVESLRYKFAFDNWTWELMPETFKLTDFPPSDGDDTF